MEHLHSDHQRVAKGIFWVALFVLIGKMAGATKEMAIAWRYGISDVVDGYLLVINLVSWPIGVWFSTLSVVLLPLASRLRHANFKDLPSFRAELLGLTILFGSILCFVIWFGLPVLLRSSWIGLAPGVLGVALNSVQVLAFLPLPGVLIGLFSAWMLSREQHMNTMFEALPALGILMAILFIPTEGVSPLLWGTLGGMLIHLFAVLVPQIRTGEFEIPSFYLDSPHWGIFWHGFIIMLIGQIIMSATGVIDQVYAASLGSGAISTLSYANRILALILGLGATAISRATLPVFSKSQVSAGGKVTRNTAIYWSMVMFLLGLLAMIIGWVCASWSVELIFERGAFTSDDTAVVSEVLRYGLLQLPAYFSGIVLVSLLSSGLHYRSLLTVAILSLGVKLLGNWTLVASHGLVGVQLATVAMYVISTTTLLMICMRQAVMNRAVA